MSLNLVGQTILNELSLEIGTFADSSKKYILIYDF